MEVHLVINTNNVFAAGDIEKILNFETEIIKVWRETNSRKNLESFSSVLDPHWFQWGSGSGILRSMRQGTKFQNNFEF
jgi:hypothetical protein